MSRYKLPELSPLLPTRSRAGERLQGRGTPGPCSAGTNTLWNLISALTSSLLPTPWGRPASQPASARSSQKARFTERRLREKPKCRPCVASGRAFSKASEASVPHRQNSNTMIRSREQGRKFYNSFIELREQRELSKLWDDLICHKLYGF